MRNTDELWEGVLDGSVNTRATVLAQPPDVQQRIRNELDRFVRAAPARRGNPRARFRAHRVGPARLAEGEGSIQLVASGQRRDPVFCKGRPRPTPPCQ